MVNKQVSSNSLKMKGVSLNVSNLKEVAIFYQAAGLEVLEKEKNNIVLGQGEKEVLTLIKKDFPKAPQNGAGLYHTAIVHASQAELAKSLKTLFEAFPDNFTGPADHLVSEAFYFNDPEGNGLELYYDRPKNEWQWTNGKIVMATNYLDPLAFIREHVQKVGSKDKHIGHIHLKVGEIEIAKKFYVDLLGFDITSDSWPGALFISRDRYHHHIGLNIWHSKGAGKRKDELGLERFEFFSSSNHFNEIIENLNQKNIKYEKYGGSISVHDPWNNKLVIKEQ